jgi:hypothetical protein
MSASSSRLCRGYTPPLSAVSGRSSGCLSRFEHQRDSSRTPGREEPRLCPERLPTQNATSTHIDHIEESRRMVHVRLPHHSLRGGIGARTLRRTLSRTQRRTARDSCFNRRSRRCSGDMESAPRNAFARSPRDIWRLRYSLRPTTGDLPSRSALHSLGGDQDTPATSFQGAGCSRWSLLGSGL